MMMMMMMMMMMTHRVYRLLYNRVNQSDDNDDVVENDFDYTTNIQGTFNSN